MKRDTRSGHPPIASSPMGTGQRLALALAWSVSLVVALGLVVVGMLSSFSTGFGASLNSMALRISGGVELLVACTLPALVPLTLSKRTSNSRRWTTVAAVSSSVMALLIGALYGVHYLSG